MTGVGAVIGYGVVRSLRLADADLRIVGCDIHPDAVGQAWCDRFFVAPFTADPSYGRWITELVSREGINLIVPAIEQDVLWLSRNRSLFRDMDCVVAICDESTIELGIDKFRLYESLAMSDDPATIPTLYRRDYAEIASAFGSRFIAKPRFGYASKGLQIVESAEGFASVVQTGADLIFQPIVGTDESEYTTSVFSDGSGKVHARITLRRKLSKDGSTATVWSEDMPDLDADIARLTSRFRPVGAMNLQFREHDGEFFLLEINPRISSSCIFRAHFGYNEAMMTANFFLDGIVPTQPVVGKGFATRYLSEVVVHDRNHF